MAFQFSKHYTVEEARALLPEIRKWLLQLDHLRQRLIQLDQRVASLLAAGADAGGDSVNESIRLIAEIKGVLQEFQTRRILIKDLDRGLLDFPTMREGREVLLCWEKDEEDIEFWHDLDTGYSGRERL
jgi:hypothetical protein